MMTTEERFSSYLDSYGIWFASCKDFLDVAESGVLSGRVKRLCDFVPNKEAAKYFYVPANFKIEDLLKVFKHDFINALGIFDFNYSYDI